MGIKVVQTSVKIFIRKRLFSIKCTEVVLYFLPLLLLPKFTEDNTEITKAGAGNPFDQRLITMDRNVPGPVKRVQRKMKFIPKLPPKKDAKPVVKTEVKDEFEFESAKAKELMRRFNDSLAAGRPKVEKKHTPVQVAFGYGASTPATNYYTNDSKSKPKTEDVEDDDDDYQEQGETDPFMNYDGYHPVRVPMRKPYSGKPEIQDYEELAKNAERTSPAKDLGLLDAWHNNLPVKKMLFLQLPFALPMDKRPAAAEGVDTAAGSQRPPGAASIGNTCRLDELPKGHMGKLLVYKSGKVKLKLGDTLFDVSTGPGGSFAQDVAVVDIQNKSCCILGELNGLATVTPDVESILNGLS
ncbi:hypothetical protein Drorol1_Dr00005969 [Drosera rotundifolia]